MRILFITPSLPFPPARGFSLQTYHHIRELSKSHVIDLASFISPEDRAGGVEQLGRFCHNVVRIPVSRMRQALSVARAIFSRRPLQVALYDAPHAMDTIRGLMQENQYDAIVCVLTRTARYGLQGPGAPRRVLNMVDPLALNYTRSMGLRPAILRPVFREEARRLRLSDRRATAGFDATLLTCAADARDYSDFLHAGGALGWVPHIVDSTEYAEVPRSERQSGSIVMTGNMFYGPNRDAALYFCNEVFPIIRRLVPAAHVTLVGARPGRALLKLAERPGIKVTGWVADVKPYLYGAMVSACPVRLAVGTQTKVLESMAAGTPVVATNAGNHGISAIPGRDLLVADTPDSFAHRVVSLLRAEQWDAISGAAKQFVLHYHSPERSAKRLEQYLEPR